MHGVHVRDVLFMVIGNPAHAPCEFLGVSQGFPGGFPEIPWALLVQTKWLGLS